MAGAKVATDVVEQTVALYNQHKSTTKVARILGLCDTTVGRRLRRAGVVRDGHFALPRAPVAAPESNASGYSQNNEPLSIEEAGLRVPAEPAAIRRYLLTAAQDETSVVKPFWQNLLAYAGHINAEIIVGGYTYNKSLFTDHAVRSSVFASDVVPYMQTEIIDLAPRLTWYGKANILPTASDPLSGWETATRERSAVLPHAKIALKCVPVMPGSFGKQVMTTGVITQPNYIQRNAGIKGSFHHTIGATIVEVSPNGQHFCRQISTSANDGAFQDLDIIVSEGKVTCGHSVEAITFGDVHREKIDFDVAKGAWGYNPETVSCDDTSSLLDTLKPSHGFIHDSFDFTARSHHTRNDPHERVKRIAENQYNVQAAISSTASFLSAIRRPWYRVIHVASNHNLHLDRWLKDESGFRDPVNSAYWCELNAATLRAIQSGDSDFNISEYALRREASDGLSGVLFLGEGDSYIVCQGIAPIECGLHGHMGPRGARGSAVAFARTVERINVAHTHEPAIKEAVYYAGTASQLDLGYNDRGQGGWQHAHVVVYGNGKRTIITMNGAKWRA